MAQSNDELFRGTWQIDTPDQGALILMLKSQGRASYFWGDNTDRSVYQGNWTSDASTATLNWPDGSAHRIERDNPGFAITYTDAAGNARYTAQAQQVPAEILGQWAKPPARDEESLSDRDKAEGFFGIWKIGDDGPETEYVFVESDRSAASTEGSGDGLRGSWAKQGSELHIAWDSGHYSIIRENKREFTYKRIAPGQIIEDDTSEMRPAVRTIEEKVPAAWMDDYREESEVHTGGIAFSSRKTARDFYRGDWIVKHSDNLFERIQISRFGGLSTSAKRDLQGDWRMQGQDIFMRWDDGMRKILSPIGRAFVLYEYKPGRPLDGVPTRTRAAAPADTNKLTEHLKGRADVARQIRSLAEAAGIDSSEQEEAGWGRTFARWAWPFSENEAGIAPEVLLQEEYEATESSDPWWWPFWSENTSPQPDASKAEPDKMDEPAASAEATKIAENEAASATPPVVEEDESITLQVPTGTTKEADIRDKVGEETDNRGKKRSSARDWDWPF